VTCTGKVCRILHPPPVSGPAAEGRACARIVVTSAVFRVAASGVQWTFPVEAGGLDSAANRGIPTDSRDEGIR
jgi:hypothetical protein